MIEPMSLAAVIAGSDGLIIEVHDKPEEALCDKNQAININELKRIIDKIKKHIEEAKNLTEIRNKDLEIGLMKLGEVFHDLWD